MGWEGDGTGGAGKGMAGQNKIWNDKQKTPHPTQKGKGPRSSKRAMGNGQWAKDKRQG